MKTNSYFVDEEHRENFKQMCSRVKNMAAGDTQYLTVGYVLALPELYQKGVARYFDDDGFDYDELVAKVDLSHGYRLMVDLARHLFNGRNTFDLYDAVTTLDLELWDAAIQAMSIRRCGWLSI